MIFSLFIILINENYNVSPLHCACETSNSIIAKILLDKGANPNTVRISILAIIWSICPSNGDGILSFII